MGNYRESGNVCWPMGLDIGYSYSVARKLIALASSDDRGETDAALAAAMDKLYHDCLDKDHTIRECTAYTNNGAVQFCEMVCKHDSVKYALCKTRPELMDLKPITTPGPCPTFPTTTKRVTTQAPFPAGTLLGGVLLGVFIGIVLTILVKCLCKNKSTSDGLSDLETGKKKKTKKGKKGKKSKTTSTGKTGTGTNTAGSSNSTEGKKKKKAKGKKGKKGNKGSRSTTKTGSGF